MRAVSGPPLPPPFRWEGGHVAAELDGGRVLFSTRRGGVSKGPFASLNLGRLTADDGANVDANRERLAEAVGVPRERFLYGRQVHGAHVRRASEPPSAVRPAEAEDGQATALRDAAALVFTADCLPVALTARGAVAAVGEEQHRVRAHRAQPRVVDLLDAGRLQLRAGDRVQRQVPLPAPRVVGGEARVHLLADLVAAAARRGA